MLVMKFGGTSLGNAGRIEHVAGLIRKNGNSFVVCSAMSGVTNLLVEVANGWRDGKGDTVKGLLGEMKLRFEATCYDLFGNKTAAVTAIRSIDDHFSSIAVRLESEYTIHGANWLLAQGEIITSDMIARYMNFVNIPVIWLNAFDFVQTGADGEPSVADMRLRLNKLIGENPEGRFLTQGYICMDHEGNPSNLKRGGSDYTATLAGAALGAEVIEIWTDIDGVRNNDPRIVENTYPIRELSFQEAAELAYFGAKILHPSCVWPARSCKIPIQLKNTMEPDAPGTLIATGKNGKRGVKAVAAKDNITVIRIQSARMLNAYGFLNRIFSIFQKYKTAIDVITTSEVAVSVTIDDDTHLSDITGELSSLGEVFTEKGQSIVCVVGDILEKDKGHAVRILDSLRPYSVKMISYGGSTNNITIVVPEEERNEILRSLNSFLFENNRAEVTHD